MKIYFVGATTDQKGIKDFNFLAEKLIELNFFWYTLKVKKEIIEKYPKINFIVGLNDADMKAHISKNMDIFISCSRYEGFSLPIAEAMLLKKPVIGYNLQEVRNCFEDNMIYIKCFDIRSFYKELKNMVNNGYIKDLVKSKNYVIENYSPKQVSKNFISILNI